MASCVLELALGEKRFPKVIWDDHEASHAGDVAVSRALRRRRSDCNAHGLVTEIHGEQLYALRSADLFSLSAQDHGH